jgi:(p)ppGpp synthase/HD superfamily hydrolase
MPITHRTSLIRTGGCWLGARGAASPANLPPSRQLEFVFQPTPPNLRPPVTRQLVLENEQMFPREYQLRAQQVCGRFEAEADRQLVWRAFRLSCEGHYGQKRKDQKTPYIEHPGSVAEILADWGVGAEVIAAGFDHDLVEKGDIGGQRVELSFLAEQLNERVARIIDGATELGKKRGALNAGPSDLLIYQNYLSKGAGEPASFLVRLADRLDNMRTLIHLTPDKQHEKALETRHVYCRFADILGMWQVKRELEDLAFRYLEPEKYNAMKRARSALIDGSRGRIPGIVFQLERDFKRVGLAAEFKMGKRAIYELHQRLSRRGIDSPTTADVWRLHIFTADELSCYTALGLLHADFPPVQGEFRDYLAEPPPNRHRFLHSVVNVPGFERLLVQIRDRKMKQEFEQGGPNLENNFTWLNTLQDYLRREGISSGGFYDLVAAVSAPINVYNVQGSRIQLPFGSTALDFAREQGEGAFLTAKSATINYRPASLFSVLQEGDRVTIIRNDKSCPELGWIKRVRTPQASETLRQFLKQRPLKTIIDSARAWLGQEMRKHYLPAELLLQSDLFISYLQTQGFSGGLEEPDGFLYKAGIGEVDMERSAQEFMETFAKILAALPRPVNYQYLVSALDRSGLLADITMPLKDLGINLTQLIIPDFPADRMNAVIFLEIEGAAGSAGAVQQIQVRTIISSVAGVKNVVIPETGQVAALISSLSREAKP